ncbi:hypothetical protein ACUH93_00515 [Dermabacteraceae bacterium P7006]
MLTRVEGRLKLPHGEDGFLFDGDGRVHFRLAAPGTHDGALRAPGTVTTSVTAGVMAPVELAPGLWQVEVDPDKARCWRFKLEITPDTLRVDLASYAPTVEIEGVDYARGLSAYEVAVSDGYQGTRTQWLESLHAGYEGVRAHLTSEGLIELNGGAVGTNPERGLIELYSPGDHRPDTYAGRRTWSVNPVAASQGRRIDALSYDKETNALYSGYGDANANGDKVVITKHDLDTGKSTVVSDKLATEAVWKVMRHGQWLYAPHIDYNGNFWGGGGYATNEGGTWHDVKLPGQQLHTFDMLSTPEGLWACGSIIHSNQRDMGPALWFRPDTALDDPEYDDQADDKWLDGQNVSKTGWRLVFLEPAHVNGWQGDRYYAMRYEAGRVWVHAVSQLYPVRGFLPDGSHVERSADSFGDVFGASTVRVSRVEISGYVYTGGLNGVITRSEILS